MSVLHFLASMFIFVLLTLFITYYFIILLDNRIFVCHDLAAESKPGTSGSGKRCRRRWRKRTHSTSERLTNWKYFTENMLIFF